MFPRSNPAGYLNVNGDMVFTKLASRIRLASVPTNNALAQNRTIFVAAPGQNTVFGAMPGAGIANVATYGSGNLAAIQVYSRNLDPMPPTGFRYGDLRCGDALGQVRLTSAALGPNSDATGAPSVLPLCFFVNGISHLVNTDGSLSFNGGQTTIDASGNLVLTGAAQATQIGLGITPVEAVHIGVGGKLRIDNSVGYHFTNYYNAGLDRLDWEWASAGAIMTLDSTGALLVASTIVAGGSITAASLVIGGVTWSGAGNNAAMQRIAQVVCAGSQSTVSFSSIPAGFTTLKIFVSGRDTKTTSSDLEISLEINGDTTSGNYTTTTYLDDSGTSSLSGGTLATSSSGSKIAAIPGSSGLATAVGEAEITITNYSGTTFNKIVRSHCVENYSATATQSTYLMQFVWKSTAAINALLFTAGGTAFVNGTTFTLYGMP